MAENFIFSYSVFVFFVIFITIMGADAIIEHDAAEMIREITIPTEPDSSWWQSLPIIGWLGGFISGVWDIIKIIYTLLKFSSNIQWITFIIIMPMTITLIYMIAKLFRGGG